MDILPVIIAWINGPVNALSALLLAPIKYMPGWLSNTILSGVIGIFLLVIFKYTSNQKAIGKIRDGIKADMIAIKLFKDNVSVILSSQLSILSGSARLLFHSIKPLAVMVIPVLLLLSQMGLWYQARPLTSGEETLVIMKLNIPNDSAWPEASIESISGADILAGPVRIFSKNEILWKIRVRQNGTQRIQFKVNQETVEKKLTVGNGYMQVSTKRPGWNWAEILAHPTEPPFHPESAVQSVTIDYPDRQSKVSGTDWWVIYFFVCSMIFALLVKPLFKVRI